MVSWLIKGDKSSLHHPIINLGRVRCRDLIGQQLTGRQAPPTFRPLPSNVGLPISDFSFSQGVPKASKDVSRRDRQFPGVHVRWRAWVLSENRF
jgi:hypothetical protein